MVVAADCKLSIVFVEGDWIRDDGWVLRLKDCSQIILSIPTLHSAKFTAYAAVFTEANLLLWPKLNVNCMTAYGAVAVPGKNCASCCQVLCGG